MERLLKKDLHPLFAKIYVLNKSWTKKIIVGLEYSDDGVNLEPGVRICGKDDQAIKINLDEWTLLKKIFTNIEQYFNGECDNLRDSECHGSTWRLRFTFAHRDRAISIQEVPKNIHQPFGLLFTPQSQQTLVMKKVSFETLNEHVVKLVDQHLEKLKFMAPGATDLIKEVCNHIEIDAALKHDAQIQVYKPWHVKSHIASFTQEKARKLQKTIEEKGYSLNSRVHLLNSHKDN